MASHWGAPSADVLRRAYALELAPRQHAETILQGQWRSEADFIAALSAGTVVLGAIHADETGPEVLGLVGINRYNATRGLGYVFYSRYRDSVLFWDGMSIFIRDAFQLIAARQLLLEQHGDHDSFDWPRDLGGRQVGLLRAYKFVNGEYVDVLLWAFAGKAASCSQS